MLIKTIPEICEACDSVVEANKIRLLMIQKNINNLETVDNLFISLENAIAIRDMQTVADIVRNQLFFEEIVGGVDKALRKYYRKAEDKEIYMQQLKKAYIIHGVKGMQWAWTTLLKKRW